MTSVEEQFKQLGLKQEIEESQDITTEQSKKDVREEERQDTESSSDDSEESGDYAIMFPDENVPGKFETKFFDKEGFTIMSLTAKKLEKKSKKKKKKQKQKQKR